MSTTWNSSSSPGSASDFRPTRLLRLGPGDDAAVLRMAGIEECAITVDLLTEGVDFLLGRGRSPPRGPQGLGGEPQRSGGDGRPALGGGGGRRPAAQGGRELAVQLYEGILPLAEEYDLAIAGGDTNSWDGPLVITATLLGQITARGPLCRKGAMPGDRIIVSGAFGGSILGRQFDFDPRIKEALLLNDRYDLHAGMDVSDGLAIDLGRLVGESGVGAIVDVDRVPIHEDARRLARERKDGRTPLEHALGDGEDFELLLAVPPDEALRMVAEQPLGVPLTEIGEYTAETGLWQREAGGPIRPLTPSGWEHTFR